MTLRIGTWKALAGVAVKKQAMAATIVVDFRLVDFDSNWLGITDHRIVLP